MRFLIDENIDIRIDAFLESKGFDIKRVSSGAQNGTVAKVARHEKRIL